MLHTVDSEWAYVRPRNDEENSNSLTGIEESPFCAGSDGTGQGTESLPRRMPAVYRESVAVTGRVRRGVTLASLLMLFGCTTVDPGPNYVVPDETFDADFFYCHVEPELIVRLKCGPGDSSQDAPNSCHFNPAVVTGMQLLDHPAVNCGGGDHPVDSTQIGTGSPAQSDLEAASFEMSRDYVNAPIFVRPSGTSHPRTIFSSNDPAVNQLLLQWSVK